MSLATTKAVDAVREIADREAATVASYALIGGAACDIVFGEAGLPFRATKDFDIVLCVEVVGAEFGTVFADFLEAVGYRARERSTGRREFYRWPGGRGQLPTRGSHGSGRAPFGHPAPQIMVSLLNGTHCARRAQGGGDRC